MKLPPFLLAGVLAFWGWRSGNYAAAVLLAVAAEAPRFVRARFDFSHADLQRVADLCGTVFVGLAAWLVATLEPPRVARAVLGALLWLPAVLSPLFLAQQFNAGGRIPLSAIFRYLRRMRARDPSIPDPAVDLSGAYFAIALVASGIPNQRDDGFYAGAVLLSAWALAGVRPRHVRLGAWAAILVTAAGIGFGAYRGLGELQSKLEDWIAEWHVRGLVADPYRSSTDLGAVGRLKLIDTILLRVYATPAQAERHRLLHRASFTALYGKTWVARNAPMRSLAPQADGTTWTLAEGAAGDSLRLFAQLDGGKALLALPAGTLRLSGMAASNVQRNALGAVQAELGGDWAPYTAEIGADNVDHAADYAAPMSEDLLLPPQERAELERVAAELRLAGQPAREVAARVRGYLSGFSYSTFRENAVPAGSTPLGDFLRRTKSGHCEYFAAAATLLLRAGGVPARYATGFALIEWSPLEEAYVVRARHAHAWARAWIDGAWTDVDTTPPSWVEEEEAGKPSWQPMLDLLRWAGFRFAQRGELEGNAGWYALLAFLVGVFAWRLMKGKKIVRPDGIASSAHAVRRGADSEFFALEQQLAAANGARPAGETLAAWVGRVAPGDDAALGARLQQALALHNRLRFDPAGLGAGERDALRELCRALGRLLPGAASVH